LALVAGFGAALAGLLLYDFGHWLAPWVWVAMLTTLAGTFIGVPPRPGAVSLLPHDPGEPAAAPPLRRAEWLALIGLLLLAAALRVWNLDNLPPGMYIDEGDRALAALASSRGTMVDGGPFLFFGTGWWGVPNLYFWLVGRGRDQVLPRR
jgi:hypothetical protein